MIGQVRSTSLSALIAPWRVAPGDSRPPRAPVEATNWRATALVLLAVVMPIVSVIVLVPEARSLSAAAWTAELATHLVILIAALLMYFNWRLTASEDTGWLTIGLAIVSTHGLVGTALVITDGGQNVAGWLSLITLGMMLGLLSLVVMSRTRALPADPLGIGICVSLLLTTLVLLVVSFAPELGLESVATTAGVLGSLVGEIGVAIALLHMSGLPMWAKARLAVAVLLIGFGTTPTYDGDLVAVLVLATMANLGGAVLLLSTTVALLRSKTREQRQALIELGDRLVQAESEVREDQARLHEISSMVAGIAVASELVRDTDLTSAQRDSLEGMLESEMGRLQRLMSSPSDDVHWHSLDGLIRPLVVAHQVRNRDVRWIPSGVTAQARGDDLSEVLNVLLENAARHAPGAAVRVTVVKKAGSVTIVVSDTGPGIPPAIRPALWDWGTHRPESPGQGIGLNVARRLMRDQGGDLRIVETSHEGTTFVVELPGGRPNEVVDHSRGREHANDDAVHSAS